MPLYLNGMGGADAEVDLGMERGLRTKRLARHTYRPWERQMRV